MPELMIGRVGALENVSVEKYTHSGGDFTLTGWVEGGGDTFAGFGLCDKVGKRDKRCSGLRMEKAEGCSHGGILQYVLRGMTKAA